MKYFVSSDVHGFYNAWIKALEEKQFNINNPEHKIIVCGDLFDRGSEAVEVQSFVMELIKQDKIILIKGNHEDLALELIQNYANYIYDIKSSHHWHNGTFQTLLQLTGMNYYDAITCLLEFKRLSIATDYVRNIIPKMVNYYETNNYVFVHAWVPLAPITNKFDTNWRNAGEKAWEKARWHNPVELYKRKLYLNDKTLVFGHWHCSAFWANKNFELNGEYGEKACYEPFITDEIIALDACTVISGKVNVIVLED